VSDLRVVQHCSVTHHRGVVDAVGDECFPQGHAFIFIHHFLGAEHSEYQLAWEVTDGADEQGHDHRED